MKEYLSKVCLTDGDIDELAGEGWEVVNAELVPGDYDEDWEMRWHVLLVRSRTSRTYHYVCDQCQGHAAMFEKVGAWVCDNCGGTVEHTATSEQGM